ncbi:MAG: heavy metal translocating P-type ATPase [Campylobacter sp.]|nr:heavy metal translocating P-type ATPase [Campylobacter sp.]
MQKPSLKTPKILHQSKFRVRFKIANLNKKSNLSEFEENLAKFNDIKEFKINPKIGTLTIKFDEKFKFEKFIKFIENFKFTKIKKTIAKTHSQTPSKSLLMLSGGTLVLNLFFKTSPIMRTLSLVSCLPILSQGAKEFFKFGLTSKMLEALAVGISLARKDFIAANSTNAMLALGEYIEESTVFKSDDLIRELARPDTAEAWVEQEIDGKIVEIKIPTNKIKIGDIVVVGTGDIIAIDGHIVSGEALVNQVSMTGEAEAVKKGRGDRVLSGTVVEDGKIRIWAELVGKETSTQKIKQYILASLDEKSQIGLKATKLADKLIPITFGLAGFSYLINKNMQDVASVLQADYSCALKLPTPVAFKSSISKAGKNGILIKGAKALEALYNADTFVFDKTGTLTYGNLEVAEINSFNTKFSDDDLLNLTASAEEHYFHPVAQAIVEAAKERGFIHMHHEEVQFIVAHGVKTQVSGKPVVIGSRHFLEDDEKISFAKFEDKIEKSIQNGLTLLYIAYDNELLGTIGLVDYIRTNAKQTFEKLKKLGVKEIVMLSGDVESKAKSVAKELGIDKVFANLLPTDKTAILENLKKSGRKVAFVGDGINDAPSLIKADVGISMQKGAGIAKATSDISLLKDDIMAVAQAKELANNTLNLINRNFNTTVGINSAILLSATLGLLNPTLTAFLHNGTTIGLLINAIGGVKFANERR